MGRKKWKFNGCIYIQVFRLKHKNPFCKKCKIPMKKKGKIKVGEKRYKCIKCGDESDAKKKR